MLAPGGGHAQSGEEAWRPAGLASGVSIVTAGSGDTVHGATVSAFSVISRETPVATITLRSTSFLLDLIHAHGCFVINVLAGDQAELARHFSSRRRAVGRAQFEGVPLAAGREGVPILAGTVCWLRCRPGNRIPVGDHELVLGDIVQWRRGAGTEPLLYLGGTLLSARTLVKETP
jgi:flavin reductase (DIM6/NTAB) family NADH-FMN oxidoreductase RutF